MDNLKGIIHDIANKLTISKAISRNLSNLLGRDHKEVIRLGQSLNESEKLLEQLKEKSIHTKRKLPLENIQKLKETEAIKVQSLASLYDIEIEYRNEIEKDVWINLNSYSNDRIICNCIENAKNAGASKVVLEYSLKESHLQLNIKDNGSGMSNEALEKVGFGYTTQDGKGHGVGTQVIRSMIQELGGSVEWNSIEDLGTCCKIKFKIENDLDVINQRRKIISESEQISESPTIVAGKRVLVISKSPMELGIWKEYLNSIGARTITSEFGETALNLIYKENPHCILVGKDFKDMSAKRWIELINSESNNAKIPKILYITETDDIDSLNQFKVDDIINYSIFDNKKIFQKFQNIFQITEINKLKTKKERLARERELTSA